MIHRSNFLIKLTDLPRFCVFFQEINFSLACFIHLSFLTVVLTISIGFTYNKESPLLLMSLGIFYFFSLNFNASRNVYFFRDFVEVRVMRQYERFASLSILFVGCKVPFDFVSISNYIRGKVSGLASRGRGTSLIWI